MTSGLMAPKEGMWYLGEQCGLDHYHCWQTSLTVYVDVVEAGEDCVLGEFHGRPLADLLEHPHARIDLGSAEGRIVNRAWRFAKLMGARYFGHNAHGVYYQMPEQKAEGLDRALQMDWFGVLNTLSDHGEL